MPRRYVIKHDDISVSTAISIIQLKSGASSISRILRAWVTQKTLTTNAYQRVQIVRKSGAATVTAFTPLLVDPGDGAAKAAGSTSGTGITASAEGTDTDILINEAFSILNGWLYLPVPEERIIVPPAGIIALKFPSAPGSAMNVSAGILFEEEGG